MKRTLLKPTLIALALAFSLPTFAADRPVIELMELTDMEASHNTMVEQTSQQVDTMMEQLFQEFDDEDPRVKEAMDRYQNGTTALITSNMDWETVGPDTAAVMESIYTNKEIRQLITFYKSDLGQMLRAKRPLETQELMAKQGEKMQRMTVGIQNLAQQLMIDLQTIKRTQ